MPSSLFRNGGVLTRRDADGSDGGTEGVVVDKRNETVDDARRLVGDERASLTRNGFELLESAFREPDLDFLENAPVIERYYPHCAQLVAQATGAGLVVPFDHNVRSAQGQKSSRRIEGGQRVQPPAHIVHGDYTLASASQRLRELARPPSGNDTLRPFLSEGQSLLDAGRVETALGGGGRFAIINVWRSISDEPVATRPLALCDAQTVDAKDLVVFEIHYADRIGENYFAKHSSRHRWLTFPAMRRDEALLIKQWDSAGPLARSEGVRPDCADPKAPCTFSFHSAYRNPVAPAGAPDRWSIEVRCVALYDS